MQRLTTPDLHQNIEYWVSIKGYVLSFCIGFLFRQISSPAHDPKQFVFICSDRMCREIKQTNIDLFHLMTIAAFLKHAVTLMYQQLASPQSEVAQCVTSSMCKEVSRILWPPSLGVPGHSSCFCLPLIRPHYGMSPKNITDAQYIMQWGIKKRRKDL